MEDRRFVKQDASAVDGTRKRHLFRMEVFEGGFAPDLVGLVAQNVEYRVGRKKNVGVGCEVWRIQQSALGRDLDQIRPTVNSHKRLVPGVHEVLMMAGPLKRADLKYKISLQNAPHAPTERALISDRRGPVSKRGTGLGTK